MYEWIDWDQIPDLITKEQFYQICHISKTTARYLLQSGKVPCRNTGKRTRCYQIRKEDVQDYLHKRGMYPEHYSATPGWYGTKRNESTGMPRKLSPETLDRLHSYYNHAFSASKKGSAAFMLQQSLDNRSLQITADRWTL